MVLPYSSNNQKFFYKLNYCGLNLELTACQYRVYRYPLTVAHGRSGVLTISTENRKFRLENSQMVRVIPFGTFCKLWAIGWGETLFAFFSVFSMNLGKFWTFSFFCKAKFSNKMFTHEISDRVVRVNGKYPRSHATPELFFVLSPVWNPAGRSILGALLSSTSTWYLKSETWILNMLLLKPVTCSDESFESLKVSMES